MRWLSYLAGFTMFFAIGFWNGLLYFGAAPERVAFGQNAGTVSCELVPSGYGPQGSVPLNVQVLVSGLEVPWAMAALPDGRILVTERKGQLRMIENGKLLPKPVIRLPVQKTGEGGLLGLAIHPDFRENRYFYLYYTTRKNGQLVNRIARYVLSTDGRSARRNRVILDNIPGAEIHDGGRIHFGPDRMLYIGTGDARAPGASQNLASLSGKILRLTPEGEIPGGNPFNNFVFAYGLRNPQGFAWLAPDFLAVVDHGPSGEMGRTGHDELNWVRRGDNLGWPATYGCAQIPGLTPPVVTWKEAMPPASMILYSGSAIPEWRESLLIATLASEHLHRVRIEAGAVPRVVMREVYLGEHGRLREVFQAPDGSVYVSTSNCDGRGECPPEKDVILRLTERNSPES